MIEWYHYILATLFAFAAVALMGVILLQRGKGVGLSGAFGGAGGHTAFGAKTGDVLTWITIVGAIVVLTGAVVLNYVFVPLTPLGAPAPPPPTAPMLPPVTPPPTESQTPDESSPAGGGEAPESVWNAAVLTTRPLHPLPVVSRAKLG